MAGVHNAAYDEKHRDASKESAVSADDVSNSDLNFCTNIANQESGTSTSLNFLTAAVCYCHASNYGISADSGLFVFLEEK